MGIVSTIKGCIARCIFPPRPACATQNGYPVAILTPTSLPSPTTLCISIVPPCASTSSRDLVDPSTYGPAVTSVLDFITQRMEYLTFTPET